MFRNNLKNNKKIKLDHKKDFIRESASLFDDYVTKIVLKNFWLQLNAIATEIRKIEIC